MSNIIELRSRMKQLPPVWGADVRLSHDGSELVSFYGQDDLTPEARCVRFAEMLEALAVQLRETAEAIAP